MDYNDDEIIMMQEIKNFIQKLDNAYKIRYGTENIDFRKFILTDSESIYIFFFLYIQSKFYKNDTEEEKKINRKISEQFQNIIFEYYIIFEFEIFDESKLFKENCENDYEMLYNLNKTQNLIIKTRILWEKVMNLIYLVIERKELDNKRSKKKKFKSWCNEKGITFLDEIMQKLEAFDNTFRTGEVHEYSKLKKYLVKNENQNINLYCLDLLWKFSNETIFNILAYICGEETNYKMWQKLPENISEKLKEFTDVPEWVTKYSQENDIKLDSDGIVIKNF